MIRSLLAVLFTLYATTAFATNYYVSPSGSGTACTVGTECLLSYANGQAQAGDTIYLRGGTYNALSGQYINPTNSGSSGHTITYTAYAEETPIIEGDAKTQSYGIYLKNDDYIKIEGITIRDTYYGAYITTGSDYNEIVSCTMYGTTEEIGLASVAILITAYYGRETPCTNNWIHSNIIHNYAGLSGCQEGGDVVKIGSASTDDQGSNNNTIEDNIIYAGGHSVVQVNTHYNVVRNNFLHNEGWKTDPGGCKYTPDAGGGALPGGGKYGHRVLSMAGGPNHNGADDMYNLVERNRVGNGAANPANGGPESLTLRDSSDIIRYNTLYGSDASGLYLKNSGDALNNHIYNNTIFHNGRWTGTTSGAPITKYGIEYTPGSDGNVFKNNIISENVDGDIKCQGCVGSEETQFGNSTWANNMCDSTNTYGSLTVCTAGSPTFANTDLSDPTSSSIPDLSLVAGSDGIDGGTYLTQANGSRSNSTTLVVDDALYFQAGSSAVTSPMGSSISNIQADWIAIGTVNNVVQISDINYSTNTITLKSPMTWSDNAKIWLYKDSSGKVVVVGSAPDQGAYEYSDSGLFPPVILQVK